MSLRGTITIVLASALIILLNWVRQTQPFIKATTHQPERFTELYFTNPNNLPTTVSSGQVVPISFTIHNVEARDMTYDYSVILTDPSGRSSLLDRQELSLANGGTKVVTDESTLPRLSGRAEISVVLQNQSEAIHFWLGSAS